MRVSVSSYEKFNVQVRKWKQEWIVPHHMLQKRSVMFPSQHVENFSHHAGNILACQFEWLVKWRGLDYEHATWELEIAPFMNSPEAQSVMRDYENRLVKAKGAESLSIIDKVCMVEYENSYILFYEVFFFQTHAVFITIDAYLSG